MAKYEGWLARCWKIISATATWSAVWTLMCRLFNASFPVSLLEKICRRPKSWLVMSAVWSSRVVLLCTSSCVLLQPSKRHNVLLVCEAAAAFVRDFSRLSGGRLSLWRCVCRCRYRFFPIGTGFGGVTVSVLFCSGGTVVFVSSAASVVFRGYSVARLPLLEAQAFVVVYLFLRSGGLLALPSLSVWFLFCPGHARHPGRGTSMGLMVLACLVIY